jgi:hypothetical protein
MLLGVCVSINRKISHFMQFHSKIENAILSSKRVHDVDNLENVKMILSHKIRVLNHRIEKLMIGEEFEQTPKFKAAADEFASVSRLMRIAESYVG